MEPLFKAGERVRFVPDLHERQYAGDFEVVTCLPVERGEQRYRIRSLSDGHLRSVGEAQIRRVPARASGE